MLLATKTLEAIDQALIADQGAKYRGLLKDLMPLASDAYDTKNEEFRTHLGASLIGRECTRELWYSFHWATSKKFNGQILRLFNRGHLEEPRMVALLKMIGCDVYQFDENGKQFRIRGHAEHFGGSLDGIATGIPDLPAGVACLLEFKTHNDKSFQTLKTQGVMTAKWEHVVQQTIYMGKIGLQWSLYMVTNKNNDEIHAELIRFDPIIYHKYLDRSVTIIDAPVPPAKISESPAHYKCKFCDHFGVCHDPKVPAAINCRTCLYSEVRDQGQWVCTNESRTVCRTVEIVLTPAEQRKGCQEYTPDPVFK